MPNHFPDNKREDMLEAKPVDLPKMSSEEIIDLKLRLQGDHELLEAVAGVFAREGARNHSKWNSFTTEQKIDWAIDYAIQATIVLTELISLPEDEWKPGCIPPEEYASEIPLQTALIKMSQVAPKWLLQTM